MKKIVNGKLYDTETAEYICDVSTSDDVRKDNTDLYRSPKGQFFIAGESGPEGRFAQRVEGGRTSGSGMMLVDEEEARSYVERLCSPQTYARLFGQVEEG